MKTLLFRINKILGLACLLFLLSSNGLSQEVKEKNIEDTLYYKALYASLDKMAKEWGKQDDSLHGRWIRTDYLNRIVQRTDVTEGLPSQVGEYRVEYLDFQGLVDKSKQYKKTFSILVGSQMTIEGERLKIKFSSVYVTYKKKIMSFAISDWSNVYFRYDCEKREYIIDKVELGGI